MRILTWNLERKKPTSRQGETAAAHLFGLAPDLMVLTEARMSFPVEGGFLAASESWGDDDERKVVMWSKSPWSDVDSVGSDTLPAARFVAGTTETAIGFVRVFGVCISWHMANVQYGDRNRRPWEDHVAYCLALRDLVVESDPRLPLVVVGDFNQPFPPKNPSSAHGQALIDALTGLEVHTAGMSRDGGKAAIDHIATRGLVTKGAWGWPTTIGGVRCSDHSGAGVDLSALASPLA